jgi:DNA replication and repair protein RecF
LPALKKSSNNIKVPITVAFHVSKKISLFNYKNFSKANFDFDSKINCFVGKMELENKCAGCHIPFILRKSYFNPLAVQNIKHGEFFVIDAEFEKTKEMNKFFAV